MNINYYYFNNRIINLHGIKTEKSFKFFFFFDTGTETTKTKQL